MKFLEGVTPFPTASRPTRLHFADQSWSPEWLPKCRRLIACWRPALHTTEPSNNSPRDVSPKRDVPGGSAILQALFKGVTMEMCHLLVSCFEASARPFSHTQREEVHTETRRRSTLTRTISTIPVMVGHLRNSRTIPGRRAHPGTEGIGNRQTGSQDQRRNGGGRRASTMFVHLDLAVVLPPLYC